MRAGDKAFDTPNPFDDPLGDVFSQYEYMDAASLESSSKGSSSVSCDLRHLFDTSSPSTIGAYATTGPPKYFHTPQPWRAGLWCLDPTTAAPSTHISDCMNVVAPSSISRDNTRLDSPTDYSLSDISANLVLQHPASPTTPPISPPSPKKTPRQQTPWTPKSQHRREPQSTQTLRRKINASPTPKSRTLKVQNHPSLKAKKSSSSLKLRGSPTKRAAIPDFDLPLSPPPSAKVMQQETAARFMMPGGGMPAYTQTLGRHQGQAFLQHHQNQHMYSQYLNTDSNPRYRPHEMSAAHAFSPAFTTCDSEAVLLSPDQSQHNPTWQTESFDTNDSLHFSPDFAASPGQQWWSPSPAQSFQSQSFQTPMLAAPTPQRSAHTLLHNQPMQGFQGLGIDFGATVDSTSAADQAFLAQSGINPNIYSAEGQMSKSEMLYQGQFDGAAAHPQTPSSRSPTLSPKTVSRSQLPQNDHVVGKKGSSKPGMSTIRGRRPSKDHRRNKSSTSSIGHTTSSLRTPKTPTHRATAASAFQIDFVNFTPSDSKKILTGVAPSGSSKTKARREQEAKEKRRQLSEAALQAVQRAGGDIEALEAVLA